MGVPCLYLVGGGEGMFTFVAYAPIIDATQQMCSLGSVASLKLGLSANKQQLGCTNHSEKMQEKNKVSSGISMSFRASSSLTSTLEHLKHCVCRLTSHFPTPFCVFGIFTQMK